MSKRESATIGYMKVECKGDKDLGIQPFNKKFMLSLKIEDDEDLEFFRKDISTAFANVLSDKVQVVFDFEVPGEVVEFDPVKPEANEPGIG